MGWAFQGFEPTSDANSRPLGTAQARSPRHRNSPAPIGRHKSDDMGARKDLGRSIGFVWYFLQRSLEGNRSRFLKELRQKEGRDANR